MILNTVLRFFWGGVEVWTLELGVWCLRLGFGVWSLGLQGRLWGFRAGFRVSCFGVVFWLSVLPLPLSRCVFLPLNLSPSASLSPFLALCRSLSSRVPHSGSRAYQRSPDINQERLTLVWYRNITPWKARLKKLKDRYLSAKARIWP